ncbi:MAG: selenium metabolism-associated LysR family transcriptional regulator [Desulfonatronovibrionaceae bacterium]
MDIRRLEVFCRVYETGSFSRAGQEMFLSQPTVSSHISHLERELDVSLFDRISRTAMPTRAGKLLYRRAKTIFSSLDETRAEMDELKDKVTGELTIGASTIPGNYFLPQVLAGFVSRYPGVLIDLRLGDSSTVSADLLSGELDLGLIGGFAENPDLELACVMQDELVFLSSPQLDLGGQREFDAAGLAELPWVMREQGSGTRLALEKALAETTVRLKDFYTLIRVQNTEAMVRCLLAQMGVGVTSRLAVEEHLQTGDLQTLLVKDIVLTRNFYLIRHKRRTIFPAARVFMDYVRKRAAAIFTAGEKDE